MIKKLAQSAPTLPFRVALPPRVPLLFRTSLPLRVPLPFRTSLPLRVPLRFRTSLPPRVPLPFRTSLRFRVPLRFQPSLPFRIAPLFAIPLRITLPIRLAITLLCLTGLSASAQSYPFAKDFVKGTVILKDSSQKAGLVKWFPSQNEKLKFRETDQASVVKYAPEDIAGFRVDTLTLVSIPPFEAYAEEYPLLSKKSRIKHAFGQLLGGNKFTVCLVPIVGYNALAGSIQTYVNFVFVKKQGGETVCAAYPLAVRMRDKKYEKAKEDLYEFFNGYPEIIEKIKAYKQTDDFFDIVHLITAVNN